MSFVTNLLWHLRELEANIAEGEDYLKQHPNDAGMLVNMRSAVRLRDNVASQFEAYCKTNHFDVVRYSISLRSAPRQQLRARELGAMLVNFQNLLGATTQSIVTKKPVDRFDAFPQISDSYLNWGYQTQSPDGTIGMVLISDSQELFDSIPVDEAIARVGEVLAVKEPSQLVSFSDQFGKSVIRHLHGWVEAHTHAKAGLRLDWLHGERISFEHDASQWFQLEKFINNATKSEWEDTELDGELIGLDVERRWFAMRQGRDRIITGKFKSGVINKGKRAELPRLYHAIVRRRVKTWLATGRTQENYELLELKNP